MCCGQSCVSFDLCVLVSPSIKWGHASTSPLALMRNAGKGWEGAGVLGMRAWEKWGWRDSWGGS